MKTGTKSNFLNTDCSQFFSLRRPPTPPPPPPVLSYFRAPATQATISSSDRDPSLKPAFALTMNNQLPFLLREIKVMPFLTCRTRRSLQTRDSLNLHSVMCLTMTCLTN